jgi:aspartate 1-decarboxylase
MGQQQKSTKDDIIIIISYASMDFEAANIQTMDCFPK